MSKFRGKIALKIEFAVVVLILISAALFSVENREFFLESVLEQNYEELILFKDSYDELMETYVSDSELKTIISNLQLLDVEGFILQNDAKLGIAYAYERLDDTDTAEQILLEMTTSSLDTISRADAIFQLAELYENNGQPEKAVDIMEEHIRIFAEYRMNEAYLYLAELCYDQDDIDSASEYFQLADSIDSTYLTHFMNVVEEKWDRYSTKQQAKVLEVLSDNSYYKKYAGYAIDYITNHQPDSSEVQTISLNLVYNSASSYVQNFLDALTNYSAYDDIVEEMQAIYSLSGSTIESDSGETRGLYYYRKLKKLTSLNAYSASSAYSYYNDYLSGDMDFDYTEKNLTIAIRNMIAYKEYDLITNITERSYSNLGLDSETGSVDKNISFWNGYAHYMLSNYTRALEELQNCISIRPDAYFAMSAKEYILKILDDLNISQEEYLGTLDYKYLTSSETHKKLHYAKVLYAFRTGYSRDILRKRIVDLTKKFSDTFVFEFDENQIQKFKNSDDYVRFVIYVRYGYYEKAKTILSLAGISDDDAHNFLVLSELVNNKSFKDAFNLVGDIPNYRFLEDNFAFLSPNIKQLFLPRPYDTEIEMALAKLDEALVDGYLVYGIIRQESMFMADAKSWAGACGLMQLMPSTAAWVAKKVWGTSTVDSYNTVNNVILGTRYINDNVDSYGFLQAVAAYNGGYTIVKKTKNKFDPANDYELIELIPYDETRNYVKKVLTNYYRYKDLYESDNGFVVGSMLGRGSV